MLNSDRQIVHRLKIGVNLVFLITLLINRVKCNQEYDKYELNNRNPGIPTLMSLFTSFEYKDKLNESSPCTHRGKNVQLYCKKVPVFDHAGYEKSLRDTRRLILSRLNLEHEPPLSLNKNTETFLKQLENKILSSGSSSATIKSKYDMKTPDTSKILNSMHEALSITQNCFTPQLPPLDEYGRNYLCINFDLNTQLMFSSKQNKTKKIQSVLLWVNVKIDGTYSDLFMGEEDQMEAETAMKENDELDDNYVLRIENIYNKQYMDYTSLKNGWNTIDVSALVNEITNDRVKVNITLGLKCMNSQCKIAASTTFLTEPSMIITNNNDEMFYNNYEDVQNDQNKNQEFNLLINNNAGKKPLLSVNIIENFGTDIQSTIKHSNRGKRKVNSHNNRHNTNRNRNNDGNFRALALDKDPSDFKENYCKNNNKDPNQECCIVSYYVNFNALKWSSWILSPSGFVANFCAGKCNERKSNSLQFSPYSSFVMILFLENSMNIGQY
jgi:hypothetical protein